LDSFIVATAYGVKRLSINFLDNFIFALISSVGTLLSMYFGKITSTFLPVKFSIYIGPSIIIIIGIWTIYDTIKSEILKKQEVLDIGIPFYNTFIQNPEKADIDKSGYIDSKESLLLGISLAANNIGMGFGAGAAKIPILITTVMTFLFSIISISLGSYAGRKCSSKLSGLWSGILSAVIFIFIGLYEFFI
jgi:putative sporulation protein YtaF